MLKEILTARTRPSDKALYNIWARKISDGWTETTITGSLPLTFRAKGDTLTDYTVHGTAEGAGVQTENLFDKDKATLGKYINSSNEEVESTAPSTIAKLNHSDFIKITAGQDYTIKCSNGTSNTCSFCWYSQNKELLDRSTFSVHISQSTYTKTLAAPSGAEYLIVNYCTTDQSTVMLVEDSTAPSSYIPYGYEIPLTLTAGQHSDDYALYTGGTQLGEDEYLNYATQKIYKDVSGTLTPTDPPAAFPAITAYQGENTLSSTETLGSVSVSGKIKEVTP